MLDRFYAFADVKIIFSSEKMSTLNANRSKNSNQNKLVFLGGWGMLRAVFIFPFFGNQIDLIGPPDWQAKNAQEHEFDNPCSCMPGCVYGT